MPRTQTVESPLSPEKDFGFNTKSQEKFLKDFKYKRDNIFFINEKDHSDCQVENGLERVEKEGSRSGRREIS